MDNKKIHARNGVSKQDSKKDNNSNPRQWPKNARRRESTTSKSTQDQQLRNSNNNNPSGASQQYRNNSERRSRWNNRGGGNNHVPRAADQSDGGGAGLADAEDEDEDELFLEAAEWDSVLVPGSKKHNLNHLLNFHYAPRDRDIGRPGNKRRDHAKGTTKSTMALYNKDQFLQANCNFIVKDRGDYKAHWNNPDSLVDWQHIEEVVIRSSEEPQCPICLFPPVAAQMTKCGHVYCWPCILHYLALSDKEWRKCPICYNAVHIKDLRSTVSWPYHEYQMNETVDFQLMCRRKGSLDVIRVGQRQEGADGERRGKFPHLFDVRDQQIVHSKLILANQLEVASVLDRERCELEEQMRTDGPEGFNCPEMMFIQQALDLLGERTKANSLPLNEAAIVVDDEEKLSLYDGLAETEADTEEYHYFYQAVDGQHLYMHSINNRMLQAQFGSLAHCPTVVTGKIIQREHFSVSDALRKRTKYLQHLPLTSIITIVEVNFMDNLLSPEVKEQFVEEINQRKRDRQRRARDEKKREKHINELNDRQMGKMMAQNAGFVREEVDYYPFLNNESEMEPHSHGSFEEEAASVGASNGSPNKPFSFAKMLQCASEIEKTQPEFWPTLENKKAGGAWGVALDQTDAAAAGPSTRDNKPRTSKMDKHFPNLLDTIEVEEDGAAPLPLTNDEPGVESLTAGTLPTKSGPKGNNSGASKRANNKKKQQWVLFSTDMNFNRN